MTTPTQSALSAPRILDVQVRAAKESFDASAANDEFLDLFDAANDYADDASDKRWYALDNALNAVAAKMGWKR